MYSGLYSSEYFHDNKDAFQHPFFIFPGHRLTVETRILKNSYFYSVPDCYGKTLKEYFISLWHNTKTMKYTVFLTLEPYLAQWLCHHHGGVYPIRLKRGSAEAEILQLFLTPQPKDPDYKPQVKPKPGQVEIILPFFKHKDIRTYNFLSERGEICLHACIRNRFKVQLWKDLHTVGNVVKRNNIAISEWMKENGIEDDDTNWNTIAKILQRNRAVYCPNKRLTNRKSSPHRKKK